MKVPEKHVVTEGRSLRAALDAAAALLGVPASQVEHKLDMAHFRSASGAGVGSDTVKIFAWAKEVIVINGLNEGEAWVTGLLKVMGIEGKVQASAPSPGSVVLQLDVGEAAPHLVGKRGTTLRAIQYLMSMALGAQFPDVRFQLDVTGGSREDHDGPRRDDRDDRGPRRDDRGPRRDDARRDDRGPRREDTRSDDRGPRREDTRSDDRGPRRDDRPDDRGPRRDDRPDDRGPRREDARRDDRPDDRGPRREDARRDDRGPRRDDRGPRRDDFRRDDRGPRRGRDGDEEELKKLARKLAQRVLATGEPEQIRRELNSYDRRVVHLEIANIPGVASRSIGEGHERRLEILIGSQKDGSDSSDSAE